MTKRTTKAENAMASNKGKETADKNPVKKAVKKTEKATSKVKVRITAPPSGMYFLPYNVGQEVMVDKNQAEQMQETGHCKIVK